MKNHLLPLITSLVLLYSPALFAQAPGFTWANTAGSTGVEISYAVTADAMGNVVNSGLFSNSVDFDPGSGQTILQTVSSNSDVFVQKVSSDGQFQWAVSLSGSGAKFVEAVTTDAAGNVYVVGSFQDSLDCDPGLGVTNLISGGSYDAFLVKLNPNGNLEWARSVSGSQFNRGYGVQVDVNGRVYFSGSFNAVADLDPGTATQNHTSLGGTDTFVLCLDQNGDLVWARSFGGTSQDIPEVSALDQTTADLYIAGRFNGTSDQDPGSGIFNINTQGSFDVFVTKLDSSGNFVWSKSMGGTANEFGEGIVVDTAGNVLISGRFNATVDLDPGAGINNHTSNGATDAFVVKLSASGDYIWSRSFGNALTDRLYDLDVDLTGNVYMTGYFSGTCDFDPGSGVANLTANGSTGIWGSKLDPNGQYEWAISVGGNGGDQGFGVCADLFGGVIFSGAFRQTVDFDPGTTTYPVTTTGNLDAYLLKLGGCNPSFAHDTITACGPFVWIDSNTYSSSTNGAVYHLTNQSGCDSVITLHLTVNQPTASTEQVAACASYTWIDGNTYTSSTDSAQLVFQNSQGCDSIVTLDLTILQPSASTDQVSSCTSYTWIDGNTYTTSTDTARMVFQNSQGCDSIVTLDLTIHQPSATSDPVFSCGPYTWIDGMTYSMSTNTAQVVMQNSHGCDSVITLDLTVVTLDSGFTATDTSIVANEATANYQWLDCDNNYQPISGANDQTFTPQEGGNYAAEISRDGCVDTTACVFIRSVGIAQTQQSIRRIYPNPNTGRFAIEFGDEAPTRMTITNVAGQVVWNQNVQKKQVKWIELDVPAGLYFLHIQSQTGLLEQKTMVISPQ